MGAGGSIPADEAAAKEAGKTDEEIAIYKACTIGKLDGSMTDYCTEDAEVAYPGAPPFPVAFMMGMTTKFHGAFPDWKSLCLGITKNDDGTYTVLEQEVLGAMKADSPAIEGTPFPEVKLDEIPEEAKVEIVFPVEVTTYTLEGGKIKKIVSAGETKEGVEGQVAEATPYMKEQWAAGKGGFDAFYGFVGKPLAAAQFEKMDADGDGELTAEEIFEALSKNNPDVTLEKVQEIVAKADADGNGSVSKQEWEEATAKDPGLVPAAWLAAPAAE